MQTALNVNATTSVVREDVNNALLLGSGILQGAGVVMAVASAFVSENREGEMRGAKAALKPVAKPEIKVLPISLRSGAGIGAVGTF